MFINLLKIRLHHDVPEKCAEITRNEAHVRMMSSVWYAARTLKYLALTSIVPLMCGILPAIRRAPEFLGLVVATLVIAFGSFCLQLYIRKFFHYQRVREIVYVLETAHYASKDHPEILSFGNASDPPASKAASQSL